MEKSLGDAAQAALAGQDIVPDEPAGSEVLIPACKVKFLGMGWDSLDKVPNLKDRMVLVVEAQVVSHEQMVDQRTGEIRDVAKARVTSVRPYEA